MGSRERKPFLQARRNRDAAGWARGVTMQGGLNETIDGTQIQVANGMIESGFGGMRGLYGLKAKGSVVGIQHDPAKSRQTGFWGGVRAFDGGLGAYYDSEAGIGEAGFNADLISIEAGARQVDRNSDNDRGARFGLSLGAPSGSARMYAQDVDGDGHTELGMGLTVPLGPFGLSIDVTNERLIQDMAEWCPPMMLGDWMADAAGFGQYRPSTVAHGAADLFVNQVLGGPGSKPPVGATAPGDVAGSVDAVPSGPEAAGADALGSEGTCAPA